MRKKYRNTLFRILQESRYGIDGFQVEEDEIHSLPSLIINFKDTPFKFIIRNNQDDFDLFDYQYTKYNPKFDFTPLYPENEYGSFEIITQALTYWLNNDVMEYFEDKNEPDLWEEYKNGNKSMDINGIDFNDKSDFNSEEKQQIKLSINELKLLIAKNISMDEDERKIVHERLDYLVDASDRLNKFDWKSLSVSTLISVAVTLSLDTQKGHLLFELFKKVFSFIPLLTQH